MRNFVLVAVIGLAAAACGSDEKKPVGGDGGSGGGAPVDLPPDGVTVESEAGRTFEAPLLEIVVREQSGGALPQITAHFVATEMDTGTDYDVQFRLSKNQLLEGSANPNLFGTAPNGPGLGKIEVDGDGIYLLSNPATDSMVVELTEGYLSAVVDSPEAEMKATIEGGYDLRCEILEGSNLVQDKDFVSEFCQEFAPQRRRTE